MIESLARFQSGLGRALRGEATCPIDPDSPGFRFTMAVRRSWCEGRSIMAARAVLKLIPDGQRQRLVAEYVNQGGGLAWFQATEREKFLAFLAPRLQDPSHALTICQVSRALARAREGASTFTPPGERTRTGPLYRGCYASLVWFYADPGDVMMALDGGCLPLLGPPSHAILFAPGIRNLFRMATEAEVAVWANPAIAPHAIVEALLTEGVLAHRPERGLPSEGS